MDPDKENKKDTDSNSDQIGDNDETVIESLHDDFLRLLRERESDSGIE